MRLRQNGYSNPDVGSLPTTMPYATHDEYFASCVAEVQPLLLSIQQEVERRLPAATRCISYQMPAFKQRRVFFYFAALKKHIGIYPPLNDDPALIAETAAFRGPEGKLSFRYDRPLPLDLIGSVAAALAAQYAER
jgi:uncharacterized protein YdhG (YjbR/CyaY superfamily)